MPLLSNSLRTTVLLSVLLTGAGLPRATSGQVPETMRDIIMFGARHHAVSEITLDGVAFEAMSPFSPAPYLLWPLKRGDSAGVTAVPYDRALAADWLQRSSLALGHLDFSLVFHESRSHRGNEVWIFRLERQGIRLLDGEVRLHWREGCLVGMVNAVFAPVRAIDEPGAGDTGSSNAGERAYVAERAPEGGYDLVLARVERSEIAGRTDLSYQARGRRLRHIVIPTRRPLLGTATITEWAVPRGSFPDQIDIDSKGTVWFSQPVDNFLTSFDPVSQQFTQYPTTGARMPDGMIVDRSDVVWTGLYDGASGLGEFDIATTTFSSHAAPYPAPDMGGVIETSQGTVWVTDHENNKILEYDPGSDIWLQHIDLAVPRRWVVSASEEPLSQDLYFTGYVTDMLIRKPRVGPVEDIATPAGGGPAFDVVVNGKVYFSQGAYDRLGVYDIASRSTTEYTFPIAGEPGGPMAATADGLIAVGTRGIGYVMLFDPATQTFDAVAIPTPNAGLKDGMAGAPDGSLWFTETMGANKIAVLRRCAGAPPPPLGNTLWAIKEGATLRMRWSDDPQADGYEAASSEGRAFAPPITVLGTVASGNPGITEGAPPGPSGIRSLRVATTLCGVRSSY